MQGSVIVSNFMTEKIAAMFAVKFTWLHVAQHVKVEYCASNAI